VYLYVIRVSAFNSQQNRACPTERMAYAVLESGKQAARKFCTCAYCIKVEQAYAKTGGESYESYCYDCQETKTWTHNNIMLDFKLFKP
jgi:hypothetical protein